jgi:hypothetical protein
VAALGCVHSVGGCAGPTGGVALQLAQRKGITDDLPQYPADTITGADPEGVEPFLHQGVTAVPFPSAAPGGTDARYDK